MCNAHCALCTMQMYYAKFKIHNSQCTMHNATPSKSNLKKVFANVIRGMAVFSKAAGPFFPPRKSVTMKPPIVTAV